METCGKRKAFGLTEILVAIALFATAMTALLAIFTSSAHAITQSQEIVAATGLAEQILEDARIRPFDSIANYSGFADIRYTTHGVTGTMRYNYDVTAVSLPPASPAIKDIAVTVSWTGDNMARRVVLETAVYR